MVRSAGQSMQSVHVPVAQQVLQRTLATLERRIDEAVAGKPEAVDLMMSNVQLVDSAALNWLLAIRMRLETMGIQLRIVNPSPVMKDVLLATRLDTRLTVENTNDIGDDGKGASSGS